MPGVLASNRIPTQRCWKRSLHAHFLGAIRWTAMVWRPQQDLVVRGYHVRWHLRRGSRIHRPHNAQPETFGYEFLSFVSYPVRILRACLTVDSNRIALTIPPALLTAGIYCSFGRNIVVTGADYPRLGLKVCLRRVRSARSYPTGYWWWHGRNCRRQGQLTHGG